MAKKPIIIVVGEKKKTEFSQWEKQQKIYIKERRALNKKQENENKNIHRKERDF